MTKAYKPFKLGITRNDNKLYFLTKNIANDIIRPS